MSIYFLERGDLIKIGFSADVRTRVLQLKTSAPPGEITFLGFMPGDREMEKHLHKKFAGQREYGEWFRSCQCMRVLIESACDVDLPGVPKVSDSRERIPDIEERFVDMACEFLRAYTANSANRDAIDSAAAGFNVSREKLDSILDGSCRAVTCGEFLLCLSLAAATGAQAPSMYAELVAEFGKPVRSMNLVRN